jgi:signal peptidase I
MFPTLTSNQRILVCKALWALGQPARGDIVVVDTENGFIVKRVAYLSGDEVPPDERPFEWPLHPNFVVPAGFVYLLGDNARSSEDSRDFGPVRIDHIVGKAMWAK